MAESVSPVLSNILFVSFLFGVFPLKRVGGESVLGSSYRFSWPRYGWTILVALLSSGEEVFYFTVLLHHMSLSLTMLLDILHSVFGIGIWVLFVVQTFRFREDMNNLIDNLWISERRTGCTSYSQKYLVFAIVLSLINIGHKVLCTILYLDNSPWFQNMFRVPHIFFTNAPVIVACQYAAFLQIVADQLKHLTQTLPEKKTEGEVLRCTRCHLTLVEIGAEVNRMFDLFLLASLTVPVLQAICKTYMTIASIIKQQRQIFDDEYADPEMMLTSACDTILIVVPMYVLVSASSDARIQSESFNDTLFSNLLSGDTLVKDNSLRMYLSMNYTIKPTACDFFPLHYSLLTSVTAASITYTILLVQFTLLK